MCGRDFSAAIILKMCKLNKKPNILQKFSMKTTSLDSARIAFGRIFLNFDK